jgi:hypothetical protein
MIRRKLISYLLIAAVAGGMILGGYLVTKKFLRDRAMAMNYRRDWDGFQNRVNDFSTHREVKTYTQKDLEEARKNGKRLPTSHQPPTPPTNPSDAAVQRSLRTLEEINRINELNQRLLDQQQRMNRQK